MHQFRVTLQGQPAIQNLAQLVGNTLPNTLAAKSAALQLIENEWVQESDSVFKYPTRGYRDSIKRQEPPDNPLVGRVVATAPYANVIEYGHGGYSLKKMLYTSDKVRWMTIGQGDQKRLVKSLIIPFRHGLPPAPRQGGGSANGRLSDGQPSAATMRSMPAAIASLARGLTVTQQTGAYSAGGLSRAAAQTKGLQHFTGITPYSASLNAEFDLPVSVNRMNYQWGDRLSGVGGIYEGMTRMGNGGGYVTFRIMHEGQPDSAWYVPPRAGKFVAKRVADKVRPDVISMVLDGFREDVGI